MGMFSAAKAVLQDLNAHQILPTLLTGAPLAGEERARQHAWHEPDQRQRRWQQQRVARLSLDAHPGRRRWGWRRGQRDLRGRRGGKKEGKGDGQRGQGGQRGRRPHGRQRRQARLGDQISGWESDNDDWGSLQGGSSMEIMQTAFSTPARISVSLVNPTPRQQHHLQRHSLGVASPGAGQDLDVVDGGVAAAPANGAMNSEDGSLGGSSSSESLAAVAAAAVPHSKSEGSGPAQGGELGRATPADHASVLRARGLDCRGWRLVVTGHSLGAAVAALVGLHLRDWCPGASSPLAWPSLFSPLPCCAAMPHLSGLAGALQRPSFPLAPCLRLRPPSRCAPPPAATQVYAFNPPGGMTTANLAAALEGFVTSVAVGKDSISRTGTVSFEQLLDQVCGVQWRGVSVGGVPAGRTFWGGLRQL
jgi:hypothetical protein